MPSVWQGTHRPARHWSVPGLLLVIALIAAACGSTIQPSDPTGAEQQAAPTTPDRTDGDEWDELTIGEPGGPTSGSRGPATVTDATEADGRPRTQTGTATDAEQPASDRQTAPAASSPSQPAERTEATAESPDASEPQAPGVTDTTLYVAAPFSRQAGEANEAIGAGGTDPGDARHYYNAVIDDLNARGGLAGREVEPIYYEFDPNQSAEAQQQAACTHWTEDHEVFAILSSNSPIIQQCAHDAGIFGITSAFSSSTTATFERYPRYVEVASVRLDRIGRVVVPGLDDQGYFDPGARIGIVTWDHPNYIEAVEADFKPALARVGQEVDEVALVSVPSTVAAVGDSQASISAAVLRFRAEGISHVMILDGPAGAAQGTVITLLFLQTAESQAYRPRYGFNTTNSQGNDTRYLFPDAQLEDAVGVIWSNYSEETDEGVTPNRQRERCLALMADSGVEVDNVNARGFAIRACSDVWFLETAVKAGGDVASVERVLAGIHGLGEQFRAPTSFGNRFAPDQRDGAVLVRNIANDSDCSCYRYPGGIYRPS